MCSIKFENITNITYKIGKYEKKNRELKIYIDDLQYSYYIVLI